MNATHEPNSWRRFLVVVSYSIGLSACFGCASYFRTSEMSYQELNNQNQQRQQEKEMFFKPGTVFYSR